MHDQETPIDPSLSDVFRSNLLPALLQLVRPLTTNCPGLLDVATFSIVLDANKIIGEIRWRLIHRQKPEARSPLFESIEAKVLIPFVPRHLEHEVLKNAELVARKTKKPVQDYVAEFERIKPFLKIHDTAMQPVEVVELADSKDLVYMATREQLNLPAIYSTDPHLQRMGAPLVAGPDRSGSA